MDFKGVKDYFSWLYYQYQIISCCAVLEPWEQSMFNTILLTIFAMVVYTAYVFIPIHIRLAWEFFSKICGYQGENICPGASESMTVKGPMSRPAQFYDPDLPHLAANRMEIS